MYYLGVIPSTAVTDTHAAALSRLGRAISDGTRTGILLALREGPARPSELAARLGVSKQVMSNQLACLRGCTLMADTAQAAGRDPDRVSFVAALRISRRSLAHQGGFCPSAP
jgi:DNA-binding transcriptional ArsR family regulator